MKEESKNVHNPLAKNMIQVQPHIAGRARPQNPAKKQCNEPLIKKEDGSETTRSTASIMNSPGMQSLMQQMLDNPNLMSAPYTQTMLQQLSSNPQLAESIIVNNPLFFRQSDHGGTNESHDVSLHGPCQPLLQSLVTNPQALSAMIQIQQGMEQLRQMAPGFASTLGLGSIPPGVGQTNSPASPATPSDSNSSTAPQPPRAGQDAFSTMVASMVFLPSSPFHLCHFISSFFPPFLQRTPLFPP